MLTHAGVFSVDFSRIDTGNTVCFLVSGGLLPSRFARFLFCLVGADDSVRPSSFRRGRRERRLLQREALPLRTSDRVTGVAIRYPPPPSAREVSARSGDGGRDSAHPTAGHMGPALQSTAGMLTERRPLRNDRRACPYNGRRGRPLLFSCIPGGTVL